MRSRILRPAGFIVLAGACVAVGVFAQQAKRQVGYSDTPFLPNSKWRVHDGSRPQPLAVVPATPSTQETPGRAPSDAVVLFDGKNLDHWKADDGNASKWVVDGGAMHPVKGSGTNHSREEFGDCQVHIEYRMPNPPVGDDQGRSNSGLFLMDRYEIQVLDNYQNDTYADGYVGSVYGQVPAMVNASDKPGQWQTMDVIFTAPRFADDGKVTTPAYQTVILNGVAVQNHAEVLGPCVYRQVAKYSPHGPKAPIGLQDHGNPVAYRNIWVRPIKPLD